ncbi:MAG: amidohydrolase [Chitinophagales bacterium]|nr:amidohydrolase [Chitinophagales bacterium]MDW8418891.1 amidohydrolase [Chitinophagales bacterium]
MLNLRITLVQTPLVWENPPANLERFSQILQEVGATDLIVLPEMFTTGFSMRPAALADTMDGFTVRWMREQAQRTGAVVCGSAMITEQGKYYNRLLWVQPDGTVLHYDKRHLFSLTGEEKVFTPGASKLIVTLNGFKICPLICYDLRFPVWSRNRLDAAGNADYDLLIYVANWPERRSYAWQQLLIARAIENQCYVVGVNRIGEDGNGISHRGDSIVLDPLGRPICQAGSREITLCCNVYADELKSIRKQFNFLRDGDKFEIY